MGSRQINFYLTQADTLSLERTLRLQLGLEILASRSPTCKPIKLRSFALEMGRDNLRILIGMPGIHREVSMRERTPDIYSLGTSEACIVEFDRCYSDDKIIRRGRFYVTTDVFDSAGEASRKSEEFISWAGQLFQKTRRHLNRLSNGEYAGDDALVLRETGIEWKQL